MSNKLFKIILLLFVVVLGVNKNLNADNQPIALEKKGLQYIERDFSEKRINFVEPASDSMREVIKLHNIMFSTMMFIFILVCVFLGYIIWRFHYSGKGKRNKDFTHNTKLEIFWTLTPLIIVGFLATLSLKSLTKIEKNNEKSDIILKVVGHQWYWTYEYPEYGIKFDSYMKKDNELVAGDKRLLSTDNKIVLPQGKNIKLIVTADDVIHAWTIPAFGVKKDCVPGRLNETWFKADKTGKFYGQCSELCGVLHGFMPIEVEITTESEFLDWANKAKLQFPL